MHDKVYYPPRVIGLAQLGNPMKLIHKKQENTENDQQDDNYPVKVEDVIGRDVLIFPECCAENDCANSDISHMIEK
jgi:hypothetical protein